MPTVPRTIVSGILALGLAACAPTSNTPPVASGEPIPPAPAPAPAPSDDKCNAGRVADVVGQPYNDALLARVKAAIGHDTIRPIQPGQPVTMDFREERLNIEIGTDGKIVRVFCA
jgi:hypothetical protein